MNVCARREQRPTNLFDRAMPSRRQRCIYMKQKSKHIALGISLLVVAVLIYGFAMWHYTEN